MIIVVCIGIAQTLAKNQANSAENLKLDAATPI